MITETEYLKAKKIVDEYNEQQKIAFEKSRKLFQEEIEKKYLWCEKNGGHEFRSSGGKYSSATQVSCISCGKTID